MVLLIEIPGISGRSPKIRWSAGENRLCFKSKLDKVEGRAMLHRNCVHQVTNVCTAVIMRCVIAGGRFDCIIHCNIKYIYIQYTVRRSVTCDLFWLILQSSYYRIYFVQLLNTVE